MIWSHTVSLLYCQNSLAQIGRCRNLLMLPQSRNAARFGILGKNVVRPNFQKEELFKICESLKSAFLTYDDAEEVKQMARRHGFEMRLISMTNTLHAAMKELVIGGNLSWMADSTVVSEKV